MFYSLFIVKKLFIWYLETLTLHRQAALFRRLSVFLDSNAPQTGSVESVQDVVL